MKPQLTIEAFADWCEKKPSGEGYNFLSMTECACAQYARHYDDGPLQGRRKAFWFEINDVAAAEPWTFGALAARLRSRGGQA